MTSYGGRFDLLAGRFADRYHVIAPDLLGHGRSDWEPPWSVDSHLEAVLASVPGGPAVWVGHSFGGRLAAELAARDPGRVERLVLLDPALQVLPHVALDLAELERARRLLRVGRGRRPGAVRLRARPARFPGAP